jgi:hypothetical protein
MFLTRYQQTNFNSVRGGYTLFQVEDCLFSAVRPRSCRKLPNVAAEWLALVIRIREVPVSNIDLEAG